MPTPVAMYHDFGRSRDDNVSEPPTACRGGRRAQPRALSRADARQGAKGFVGQKTARYHGLSAVYNNGPPHADAFVKCLQASTIDLVNNLEQI